jgi:hypothetical protein
VPVEFDFLQQTVAFLSDFGRIPWPLLALLVFPVIVALLSGSLAVVGIVALLCLAAALAMLTPEPSERSAFALLAWLGALVCALGGWRARRRWAEVFDQLEATREELAALRSDHERSLLMTVNKVKARPDFSDSHEHTPASSGSGQ